MTEQAERIANENGGVWGEHTEYTLDDWKYEVANDDTRLGYWEWVTVRIEADY